MKENQLRDGSLDQIIETMIHVVEKSKDEIFQINEASSQEHVQLQKELEQAKKQMKTCLVQRKRLDNEVQDRTQGSPVVTGGLNRYAKENNQEKNDMPPDLQAAFADIRKEEAALTEKRDILEQRLVELTNTIEYANHLGQKVSVVLTYLYDDFGRVNELLKTAKEKQEFGLKIVEAQELERKRLSREIHDGPAQMLANVLIRSELVDLSYREGNIDQALTEIKNLRKNLRTSLKEVRRIIFDLRPMALDDLGLFPTIKKHVARKSDYHQIPIDLQLLGEARRLKPNYEVAIFRLVQEALQNALKHAKADRIKIITELSAAKISVVVQDDGIGFEETAARNESFGLVGMKERIEMLKGQLLIDSKVGHGTTITFVIPYEMEED